MPPEPRWSCTIPSIHDDTPLDVRIYHPSVLSRPQTPTPAGQELWRKRGIVMAHPYAPMGGCYDDRVVGIVVEEFLKLGWVVGTFNFRGATGPNGRIGRTSWSGKPELADYQSFVGLFIHYLSYLHPNPLSKPFFTPDQSHVSPSDVAARDLKTSKDDSPIVILGGYSYGSIILRSLPPLLSILQPFASPVTGSAFDEILLKAHKLADQANLEIASIARDQARSRKRGHEHKLSVTMGGEETSPEKRRRSREVRHSLDTSHTHEFGNRLRSLSHGHLRGKVEAPPLPVEVPVTRPSIQIPAVRYLLVSPITAPTSILVAPGLVHGLWSKSTDVEATIKKHETLAVFGDHDTFASAKKLRDWAARLKEENPVFLSEEVHGAGHFWHEDGVERQLREALQAWERNVRD